MKSYFRHDLSELDRTNLQCQEELSPDGWVQQPECSQASNNSPDLPIDETHDPITDSLPPRSSSGSSLWDSAFRTAGIVGGLLAVAAMVALPSIGLRRMPWFARRASARRRRSAGKAPSDRRTNALLDEASTFAALRDAIFGQSKHQIASVLGPPPVTSESAPPPAPACSPAFLNADLWYYPFNRHQQSAIALHFSHDRLAKMHYIPRTS